MCASDREYFEGRFRSSAAKSGMQPRVVSPAKSGDDMPAKRGERVRRVPAKSLESPEFTLREWWCKKAPK